LILLSEIVLFEIFFKPVQYGISLMDKNSEKSKKLGKNTAKDDDSTNNDF
jgi:hypothetical protein